MARIRDFVIGIALTACTSVLTYRPAHAADAQQPAPNAGTQAKLVVTVGKSLIIDSPLDIRRVSVANGTLAEAVAVNPKEVLINGLAPGETSLIVWQETGTRLVYDLTVRLSTAKLDAARRQVARDFPNDDINITFENDTAFVRGKVVDVTSAERVMAIASTLGKAVNLLRVNVPEVEPQVVLKVRFANIDRNASTDLQLNIWDNKFNQQTSLGTGYALFPDTTGKFTVPSPINLLMLRPDIGLVAELQALQAKRVLEILAEPNLLTISGKEAQFLAGGEFPFPVVQPGQNGGAISITWREYGIRLGFLPVVTPRGTIHLRVAPEVSSLDYSNAVQVQGVTVPGLSSRRVQTEVELESGQTFVIAGLLDHTVRDNFSKVPGIGDIPVLGKLFQSKSISRANSELLVIITPEVVRPIPVGQPVPDLNYPIPLTTKKDPPPASVVQPGIDKTGPVPVKSNLETVPVENLMPKKDNAAPPPVYQMIPVMPQQQTAPAGSGGGAAPAGAGVPGGGQR